jgi:predicted  nucleic acid-binding Zn-ribbon protein
MSPFSHSKQRGSIAVIVIIAVVVVIAAVLLIHFLSRREPAAVQNFEQLVTKVEKLNDQIMSREDKIRGMVRRYNEAHPTGAIDTAGLGKFGLTPEQAEVLAQRVAQEKDLSYRGLLQEVIDLNQEVSRLNLEMQEVRSRLRPPHVVQKGESHFQVAMSFLTKEIGVTEEEALKLVEQEALFPELLPGFEICNYWGDGIFGTFVTQGEARISPNELMRISKRKIDQERSTLIQARNRAQEEVTDLETRRTELAGQLEKLETERTQALAQIAVMAEQNAELARQLNSVVYQTAPFATFEKLGVLDKPALGKWRVVDLDKMPDTKSIDLRKTREISFSAADAGLTKIGKAVLFPRYFVEGVDYRVEITDDRKSGKVTFLKPERFQLTKLAVALD